jgi:pimeloyl-ACP methyl ester carboxylesterase
VADDVAAVADALGIDRYAVVGMSVGGPYALACAVLHPARVTALGVVASPAIAPELDPPVHRDDLRPEQHEFFADIARRSVDQTIELMRPEFEHYVASIAPGDPDDVPLARRWIEPLPPLDAQIVADLPAADLAASAREALANPAGYLRDAAITFRTWDFRPEKVTCPTFLWYGELDPNASLRNGHWFADHIPGATLVVRAGTAHLGALHNHWDDILTTLKQADRSG